MFSCRSMRKKKEGLSHPSRGNLRGSQGTGVASNNWFDCVLLSIVYMFKPCFQLMFMYLTGFVGYFR